MAFGKKKDDEAPALASPEAEAEDEGLSLFPESDDEETPAAGAAERPTERAPTGPPAPVPVAEAAPAPDALLSMFESADGADDDRSVLLELAGDVELADLLEELNTLAAAMNVVRR